MQQQKNIWSDADWLWLWCFKSLQWMRTVFKKRTLRTKQTKTNVIRCFSQWRELLLELDKNRLEFHQSRDDCVMKTSTWLYRQKQQTTCVYHVAWKWSCAVANHSCRRAKALHRSIAGPGLDCEKKNQTPHNRDETQHRGLNHDRFAVRQEH